MSNRLSACLALLASIILLAPALARAATVEILGPAGTDILIDGQLRGTLPLSAPLEVAKGTVLLECRKAGHVVHFQPVNVTDQQQILSVELELQALSRWRAVGSSMILPGLGQLYQRRNATGWTHVAIQGAVWLSVAYFETDLRSKSDEYDILDQRYREAISQADVAALDDERQAAFDDIESAESLRTLALGVAVAFTAYSMFDAWRAHGSFFAEPGADLASAGAAGSLRDDPTGWRLGWRVRF